MKKKSKIRKVIENILKKILSVIKRIRRLIGNTAIQKGIVVALIVIAVLITAIKIYRCYMADTTFANLVSFVDAFDAIDIVACIAAGMVWIELRQNKIINEAQLVKDINNEFINNSQLSMVERALEVYCEK